MFRQLLLCGIRTTNDYHHKLISHHEEIKEKVAAVSRLKVPTNVHTKWRLVSLFVRLIHEKKKEK
jgi:hypothetical protein